MVIAWRRDGFLQVQKRPGRPELDIVRLAPGLDARRGHPAIWEKLLSHHTYEAANRRIERIYADVPDQPLPVSTFTHAGFRTYDRQTTLAAHATGSGGRGSTRLQRRFPAAGQSR